MRARPCSSGASASAQTEWKSERPGGNPRRADLAGAPAGEQPLQARSDGVFAPRRRTRRISKERVAAPAGDLLQAASAVVDAREPE